MTGGGLTENQRARLRGLLAQPTAPFGEDHVRAWIVRELERLGIAWFEDRAGNLVAGAPNLRAYRALVADPRATLFVAHMDHPGVTGVKWMSSRRLLAEWHGGGPRTGLRGVPMWLAHARTGAVVPGRVAAVRKGKRNAPLLEISASSLPETPGVAREWAGGLDFGSPRRIGHRWRANACDDLVGVFIVLQALGAVRKTALPVAALFTRAEEVGFAGCLAHVEAGHLRRMAGVAVSLEASRALMDARPGHGPVVRLGDRRTVFDAAELDRLKQVARRALGEGWQCRVMDGGSCEASALIAHGVRAVGIAVPLRNYHNQRGGEAQGRPAAESVDERDIAAAIRLCAAYARTRAAGRLPAWAGARRELARRFARYRARLARGGR